MSTCPCTCYLNTVACALRRIVRVVVLGSFLFSLPFDSPCFKLSVANTSMRLLRPMTISLTLPILIPPVSSGWTHGAEGASD